MSAIAFDPICGDGTAQAVREAILAAAVIRAGLNGADREKLATHYHSMLTASLRRHIQISGSFTPPGAMAPWWRAQVAALREGYDWGTSQLARLPEPRYVLQGYRLLEKEAAT
jgi:flavin-dependent dehydrogenase